MSDSAFDKTLDPWTQVKSLAVKTAGAYAGPVLVGYVVVVYIVVLALLVNYWSKLEKLEVVIVLALLAFRLPTTALLVGLFLVYRLPEEAYVGAAQSRRRR